MDTKGKDQCCQKAGYPSNELEQKLCKIRDIQIDLAREFTRILNDRGISGSVVEFNVHDISFDEFLTEVENENGRVGLGGWTCPPNCVCGGLVVRF